METRIAKVWRLYTFPLRNGHGTRYEAFFTAVDGAAPHDFAASTFDPFTGTFLHESRQDQRTLWVTVDQGGYGLDLVRAERAEEAHS